ncbi:MAG: outer membrane protein assembly factor, partial [Actinobacteria bacterium]|nr:outer membrane protein assembly factor [Actinomycetota bacterium]
MPDPGTPPAAEVEASEVEAPEEDQLGPPTVEDELKAIDEETGVEFSFVPIPEIILDPNEGNTYGLLGVWLFTGERDEIRYMIAPDVRYNETKGVFPNLRLFGYPTPTRRYSILVGKSTTRDENYEIEFAERGLMDERLFVLAHVLYERDSTERFFGFGNDSREDAESNYTGDEFRCDFTPGFWVIPHVNLSYRMRIRWHGVSPGQVDSEPFIAVAHPEVRDKGLANAVYWQHRLAVAYDTRDSIDMPTEGMLANAYVDGADRHVGSATSFVAFGFEWRDFIPFRGELRNPILAMRALVDYLQGQTDTPFWQQNHIGGRRSVRAFGSDRFIDFNRALMGAELRTRVYERRVFGVNAELEVAPFLEAGQVFRHIYDPPLDDLHVAGGVGFRALVRP